MPMHRGSLLWLWAMPLQQVRSKPFLLCFDHHFIRKCCPCLLAFNRTRIASEGAIPVVVEFMRNSENDIVARQYCAMTLGNLAAEPENHMEIVKSEGT